VSTNIRSATLQSVVHCTVRRALYPCLNRITDAIRQPIGNVGHAPMLGALACFTCLSVQHHCPSKIDCVRAGSFERDFGITMHHISKISIISSRRLFGMASHEKTRIFHPVMEKILNLQDLHRVRFDWSDQVCRILVHYVHHAVPPPQLLHKADKCLQAYHFPKFSINDKR